MAPRLPLAPLLALVGLSHRYDPGEAHEGPVGVLAVRVGVHRRTVQRWAHDGLSPTRADDVAIKAGWHPAEVWPGLW